MTQDYADLCPDHWHCCVALAAHTCDRPNRLRPCPSCGEEPDVAERILCAAIYVDTGEEDPPRRSYAYPKTGIVFCGWRHGDCFVPLTAWAQHLTPEERARIGEEQIGGRHQGFLTSRGRFVDREEAMLIATRAGQTNSNKSGLFSEDIY